MGLVLVDLDNTLIDRAELFRRWASDFIERHHLNSDALDWLQAQDGDGLTPKEQFFELARQRYTLADPVPVLVESYYNDYPDFTVRPPQASFDALAELKRRGWRIAIVTNGPAMQERVLDACALRPIVDAALVSSTVGLRKPDRAIFELAATHARTTLDDAWVVGDNPSHDIGGAISVGLHSIWIRRGRRWDEPRYAPTLAADSIPEAVGLLLETVS